ncbi:MAG TPA: 3-methyl-2-oxobutanoate hydroxymethyltransferase [Acidobacteriota bacterium]|nr:3-methyl-2-oxobutanoate hydroxymethyltransferase [Acidobacteriota bacterium]
MKKVRTTDLREMKARGQKITVLTAYDANMAHLLDSAGIDVLLVGDSVGNVVLGYDTTIPVTMEDMLHHTKAVVRGVSRALVVADMPFLSYQVSITEAVRNAGRFIQEAGAEAVKIEGGKGILDVVNRLVEIGIPVMGHLGLTPQSIHQLGGFRRQARDSESARLLLEDARALEEAGAFSIVLESIPDSVAAEVTAALRIPTIGIGAGPFCDGQVLVSSDAFGLYHGPVPSFVKQYANLREIIVTAAEEYAREVREGEFPRPRCEAEPVTTPARKK